MSECYYHDCLPLIDKTLGKAIKIEGDCDDCGGDRHNDFEDQDDFEDNDDFEDEDDFGDLIDWEGSVGSSVPSALLGVF